MKSAYRKILFRDTHFTELERMPDLLHECFYCICCGKGCITYCHPGSINSKSLCYQDQFICSMINIITHHLGNKNSAGCSVMDVV